MTDDVTARLDPYARARAAWQFFAFLAERFEQDRCTRAAAALAYTTLLALVPLFTVVFVTLSAFPAFHDWREAVEQFVFRNFVPALGDQVQRYLVEFADKARGLRAAGIAVLVVTVLAMMSTIESTFNVIWGIRRKRPLMVRFLVYWAVLTLGPVLIGAGMVATTYLVSLPALETARVSAELRTGVLGAFPVVASTLAFVMFFKLIPYRPVPLKHALVGGIVASVLFEVAKRGFAFYVTNFPSQQAVYGAFATVPIFLLWIYLSWVIVLLGAEITQCLTTFRVSRARRAGGAGIDPMLCAYRVLLRLYQAQQRGHGLGEKELMGLEDGCGYAAINRALEHLDAAGWISRNDVFQWVLLRDLAHVPLFELLRLVPSFAAAEHARALATDEAQTRLAQHLEDHARCAADVLEVPLASLFEDSPPPPAALEA